MKNIAIIVQARMGSTRLPGKVLKEIEEKPMLWHHMNRLKHSKYSPEIIIATSTLEKDKPILRLAKELNVNSFAGSHDDVLDRYYQAALKYKVDIIARITSDCPVIDPEVFDKVLEKFLEGNYDYVSNVRPPTFPDGLDVEIFSFETLKKIWTKAKLASEREGVTGYLGKNIESFNIYNVENEQNLSYMRWTVDEKEDLEFIREVYKNLYAKKEIFLMDDILKLLKNKPELMEINRKYNRNEGYIKSLKSDKIVK